MESPPPPPPPPPLSPPTKPGDAASTISSLSSALNSCAVDGVAGPSHAASDEQEVPAEKAEEEENLLCVILCDFLFDTPKVPPEAWDDDICDRAAAALRRCRPDDELAKQDDGKTIDIRGEYISTAIPLFLRHLHETSIIASYNPSVRCLNVIVGCIKHGVGEGLLKDEVLKWLEREKDVVTWQLKHDGAVISINLTGQEKFNFLKLKFEEF